MNKAGRGEAMHLFRRTIEITIFDAGKGTFILSTNLTDMYHDIVLKLHVSAPDYIVTDAAVEMKRIPHPGCREVYELMSKLVGKEVGKGFTKAVLGALGGENGCPNMVNLVLLSAPLAINAAAVLKQQRENLTEAEMDLVWQDVLGGVCLAYPEEGKKEHKQHEKETK